MTCTLSGSLGVNQSAVVQLVFKPTAQGTLTNKACESGPPGDTESCDQVNMTALPS